MASAPKRKYPDKIVRWVQSGRPSHSGKRWQVGRSDAYIYMGPLRGTVERDGRQIPVFNLDRSGYWGVYVRGQKSTEPEHYRNLGNAIDDAYRQGRSMLKGLESPIPPPHDPKAGSPKRRWKPAHEYWPERLRLERMSANPLSAAFKPDPRLKPGFTRADFDPRG